LLSVAGGALLAVSVNATSALLAIGTLLGYLLVYTPLKRKTPLSTLLGAVPGAVPILIGWAAASGSVGRNAWLLFGVLFLWRFPHFLAIALLYREDYAGAGFRMLPRFDADGRFTKAEIVVLTVVLVIVTILPLAGRNGAIYSLIMFAAGAFFVYHTVKLARSGSRVLASRVVHASVTYLPVVLGTTMAWKV
jgi:heme o synthase